MSAAARNDAVPGTFVLWTLGVGNEENLQIAHVSPEGIALVLKLKDRKQWKAFVDAVNASPSAAVEMLRKFPGSLHFAPNQISKVTYSAALWQFVIFDRDQNKTKLPEGKELSDLFAGVKQHLGGTDSEEEVDAWSVMKSPLFFLAVIGFFGGLSIMGATQAKPGLKATGRRAELQNLLNWLGYTIGPVGVTLIVAALAAIVLFVMSHRLIRRPVRQVLSYPD